MNNVKSRFGLRALSSALLVLMLIFSVLAVTVGAADEKEAKVTSGSDTVEYATVAEAIAALKDGDTLTLLDDATVEPLVIAKEVTVDLNGNTLTAAAKDPNTVITANAKVTVTDLSEDKKGMINGTLAIGEGGSLTLLGGRYKKGLDLGTALLTSVIPEEVCVTVSGIPTAIADDATKLDDDFSIVAHGFKFVVDGDNHYEVCGCNYVKPGSNVPHFGGTATCIDLKVCEACGAEYGDYVEHNFVHTADSVNHFEECTVCELEKNHEKHYGGTATCSAQAVCEAPNCGHGYGATLEHTPTGDLVDGNDTLHWQICSVCNSPANVQAHTYTEWTTVTEPTHDTEGSRESTCACGHKITRSIAVLEPDEFPAWAIVLIVIHCVIVIAIAVFAIIWFAVKKKSFADLKAVFSMKKTEA